jgi:hypothetical protein
MPLRQAWWYTPVMPVMREAEIGRVWFRSAEQKHETLFEK